MKQYRLSTPNPHIYHVLTIDDDQTMTLTFHGIDRELTFHPNIREDGWIMTEGSLLPPLQQAWEIVEIESDENNRQKRREKAQAARAERERQLENERILLRERELQQRASQIHEHPSHDRSQLLHSSHAIDPVDNQCPTDETTQPATARRKHSSLFTFHSSLFKPLSIAAASVVACVVIYETGLLIPMGLIGLATSGLVK